MRPLISIIVPVYNVEAILGRCLDSIIKQTYTNIEVILVDDGSKDASGYICDEYEKKDSRLKVIHIANGGVSNARNAGLQLAKGSGILFVDSDDSLLPEYVESYLSEDIDIDHTLLIQGCICVSTRGRSDWQCADGDYEKIEFHDCISENELFKHGSPYGKLYSNKIIKDHNISFSTKLKNYEDLIFFLEYIKYIERIKTQSSLGYVYNVSNTGLHTLHSSVEGEEFLINKYIELMSPYMIKDNNISAYLLVLITRYIKCILRESPFKLFKLIRKYKVYLSCSTRYLSPKQQMVIKLVKFMS